MRSILVSILLLSIQSLANVNVKCDSNTAQMCNFAKISPEKLRKLIRVEPIKLYDTKDGRAWIGYKAGKRIISGYEALIHSQTLATHGVFRSENMSYNYAISILSFEVGRCGIDAGCKNGLFEYCVSSDSLENALCTTLYYDEEWY